MEPPSSSWSSQSARFATTRWTMVLQAGSDGPQRDAAMEQFCKAYWYPVYAFIRRRGNEPEDARDSTQAFFAKLISREWLDGIEKRDTRFSTWLITLIKTHLIKEHSRDTALKRGGTRTPLPLDLAEAEEWFGAEPVTEETPERIFERRWALAVLDAALGHLRTDYHVAGKGRIFDQLSTFLSREPETGEYAALAKTMQMRENSIAVLVYRLRQHYRETVRAEVAAGLNDPNMIDAELQHLAASL
jgi:RNA polymerase sigma-70 factor (ECF subfamily)